METVLLKAEEGIDAALCLLKKGEVVALPTETVYGLAANAFSPSAVASLFQAKGRPLSDPLILHLLDASWLDLVVELDSSIKEVVLALGAAFWPGPLTLLLPRRETVADLVTAGLPHVALRVPFHPFFRKILSKLKLPLAAPSANRFGHISPTSASDVMAELQGRIPLILDGGPCHYGVESTILRPFLDAQGEMMLQILRPGPITASMLEPFGKVFSQSLHGQAPGSLESHYAPRKKLFWYQERVKWPVPKSKIGLLAFSKRITGFGALEVLSSQGDLREAAASLYGALRRLDESDVDFLLAQEVPPLGIGVAIMDRLQRAVSKKPFL